MPPHYAFCKCGNQSFTVIKKTKSGVKLRCNKCKKIGYRYGRYSKKRW